jgi:hypothetical protein
MIKLVPDPPKNPLTAFYSFGPCQGDTPVFAVRDGFPVDAMLGNACEYLKSASAIASEVVENSPPHLRALARSAEHSIELARALVEASLAGMYRAQA